MNNEGRSNDGRRADLGLLLVHGIGRQRQGATLGRIANALLVWFRARSPGATAEVERARLKGGGAPAEVTLRFGDGDGEDRAPRTVQLVESFWAEAFDPPGLVDVIWWIVGSGSWLVFRQCVDWPRRLFRKCIELRPRTAVRDRLSAVTGMVALPCVVVPFQLSMLFLALIWLVPIPALRRWVDAVFLALTEQLGDSFVFARDPVVRRALADRVARDLEAVDAEKVVVIAHSQGAAVALDMLQAHPAPPAFVSYGAGIRKLNELAAATPGSPQRPLVFVALACLTPVVIAAVLVSSAWVFATLLAIAVLVAGCLLGLDAAARDDRIDAQLQTFVKPNVEKLPAWLDVFATHDIVPAGPIVVTATYTRRADGTWKGHDPETPATLRIVNLRNPVADHNAYWRNPEGFIDPLMAWIAKTMEVDWLPRPRPQLGAGSTGWLGALLLFDRDHRVWARFVPSAVLVGLVTLLWFTGRSDWQALLPAEAQVASRLATWLSLPGVSADPALYAAAVTVFYVPVSAMLVLALHLVALSLLEAALPGPFWRALDGQLSLKRPDTAGRFAQAACWLLAYVAVVVLVVAIVGTAAVTGDYAKLIEIPRALLLDLAALLT